MNHIINETLSKEKNSIMSLIASGFGAVILLNIFITATNNMGEYQSIACVILLAVFIMIISFIIINIFSIYNYCLNEDSISFEKIYGKKTREILTVKFKDIKFVKHIRELETNTDVQKTYYFIYRYMEKECYFCEFVTNDKLYRFIFKPSERLLRILERKIGR